MTGSSYGAPALSGDHLRAARRLLNWPPERLARHARLGVGIVLQAERDNSMALISPAASRSLQHALEEAGVEWIEPPHFARLRGGSGDVARP